MGLDGLTVVTSFEVDASSTFDVRVADCLGHGVVIKDFKGAALNGGLQIEHVSNRPVAVNHVSGVASILFKDIEVQALSRFCKKLNKGMAFILVENLHDYSSLGIVGYFFNSVFDVKTVFGAR